ncbi:DUF4872 domain-containing protein [bacterium]|nr:DUF4872 domain-containing protein [bacterium]MBT3795077.1 DUF4872 domain-containing protein [bacterium]
MHILDWKNITGVHCGSVAIRNVVSYFGVDYEEALCFGLGSGLGFFYSKNKKGSPSEVIHLRAPNMEPIFFSDPNQQHEWIKETTPSAAEEKLIEDIKNGYPVFLQTDIFFLHYYNSDVNFPGHVVVCMGVDEKKKVFFVSDTNFKNIQEVTFHDMNLARSSKAEPYPLSYNHFKVKSFVPFKNLRGKIEEAILQNSYNYMNGQISERGLSSIFMILEWANNLNRWESLKDSKDIFQFAYQIIVKRGSKGAGFRYIYQDFLAIAESKSAGIRELKLEDHMKLIADKWNYIGLLLKSVGQKKSGASIAELILCTKQVFNLEYSFHTKVIDSLSKKKKGA